MSESMDVLRSVVEDCVQSVTEKLLAANTMRRYVKDAGGNLSREDANQIRQRLLTKLKMNVQSEVEELLEDNEIEEKLGELKALATECAERGETAENAFRPTGDPYLDTDGPLSKVLLAYKDSLKKLSASMDQEIEENRLVIKNNMEELDKVAVEIEQLIEGSDEK